jgi:predicted transcriptional regulator YheO
MFGKHCEVVLHDFSRPDHSIVKIANGHITGREAGGPATGLVLPLIGQRTPLDAFVGYPTRTPMGGELKSTTVFVKDRTGKVIGALCINLDVTPYTSARNVLEQLCAVSEPNPRPEGEEPTERFEPSVERLIDGLLAQQLKQWGKPVAYMRKADKLRAIRELKAKGIFQIKGAARRVARELNVSLATVYKYLEEVR